ncbi:MAG: tetratricopeptide repeat protein [Planctomycetota bacterium]|jgi:hypothetical protein
MNTRSAAILMSVLAILYFALPAFPGEMVKIVQKNGIKIEGEIVEETSDYITVKTKYGDVTISRDDVSKIIREGQEEKETEPEPAPVQTSEYAKRQAAAAVANSAEAFAELAKWCEESNLEDEAKKAYEKALELDPDFEPAREALGHIRVGEKWITKEEAEEGGYVQDENGKWVSGEDIEKQKEELEKEREKAEKYLKEKEKEYGGVPWDKRHIIKMAHYEVHCNSSRKIAERYAKIMEALYRKFCQVFAALKPEAAQSKVFITRNQKEFMEIFNKPKQVGGFYMPSSRNLYGYHGTFGVTGTTLTVLAHEGCHQFQHLFVRGNAQQFSRMPIWVLEGMAVIFEAAEISRSGSVKLEGPHPDRIKKLQQMIRDDKHITLRQMMEAPRGQFRGEHYNTAGAFTWWLLKASKKKKYRVLYEKYLIQCVENCRSGGGRGRGGRGGQQGGGGGNLTFTDLSLKYVRKTVNELEKEWKKYVLSIKLPKLGKMSGNTFKSKELGFEISRVDGSWKNVKEEDLSAGQIVCFQKPVPKSEEGENLKAYARLSVYSAGNSLGATADEKLQNWEKDTREAIDELNKKAEDASKRMADFKVMKKEKVTVCGFEAALFEYQIRNPESKWNSNLVKTRRIIICTPDRTYMVSGSAQMDKFDEYEKDFEKMAETMKVYLK